MTLDLRNVSSSIKNDITSQLADDYVNTALHSLDKLDKDDLSKPKSDKEKDFGLDKCSAKQLAVFRTTGICTDSNDSSANKYVEALFKKYLLIKSDIFSALKNLEQHTEGRQVIVKDKGFKTFAEVRDVLKTYSQSMDNLSSSALEDNEIKCKISTVSQEVYDKVQQKVLDDWDNENHNDFKPVINGVYEVKYLDVDDEFNANLKEFEDYKDETCLGKNCAKDEFYHGTGSFATTLILGHSGGFKLDADEKFGKLFGNGVYLADVSSKSAQYLGDITDTGSTFRELNQSGTLMICEAILGNCAEIHRDKDYYETFSLELDENDDFDSDYVTDEDNPVYEDYNSVAADKFNGYHIELVNPEFCIFDETRVRPKYLIDIKIVNTWGE